MPNQPTPWPTRKWWAATIVALRRVPDNAGKQLLAGRGSLTARRVRWLLPIAAVVVATVLSGPSLAPVGLSRAGSLGITSFDGCPKVLLYYSRGSGQKLDVARRGLPGPGLPLYNALAARFGSANIGSMANGYPAVAVISLRPPFVGRGYRPSVDNGVQSAARNIVDLIGLCPQSEVVLGGFSQGAQVTREALGVLVAKHLQRHVAAVIFFGDPYFNPSEKNVTTLGTFKRQQKGILRRRLLRKAMPIDPAFSGDVFSWCHRSDVICQGLHFGNSGKEHSTYARDAEAAAAQIADRLAATEHLYHVSGTCAGGPCGLAEWSGPGTANFIRVGAAYESQQVDIICQAIGQKVTGTNGISSAIWDELINGAFVSDYYLDTPNVGIYSPPIPRCRGLGVASP
jgi:cutinase